MLDLSHRIDATGVVVAAADPTGDLEVRTFAPRAGVDEDPVCGSGNVALAAPRASDATNPLTYRARQGRHVARDGRLVLSRTERGAIELGGAARVTAEGRIAIGS